MSIDMAVFTWLVVLSVDGSGWFLMLMCDMKVCSVISVFVSMISLCRGVCDVFGLLVLF